MLKTFDARGGDRSKKEGGLPFENSQEQAAEKAGLSDWQKKQAVRVANVPEPEFEASVEAEKPATISNLAKMGMKSHTKKTDPEICDRDLNFELSCVCSEKSA